ncbi:aldehyde dehydrogenase family protein [Paraburkholderia sp. RP-4-7]|uniref:Aldehyde dehydrogenase family protein n=1 Tax=Paraburkholderia polaris TaxID=2728848 RepID=A0A848IQU1_9BURK|nr:aldehyde dehydrogenase family protein [Paraburkholderia polaris]NMM04101.1 aldehyde dehydrogenase family protein [Paraburkholderia polaris]
MQNPSTTQIKKYRQLIAGEWVQAAGGATFNDMNPYDDTVFAEIPASREVDTQRAIDAAAKAFPTWAAMGARERQALFLKAADILLRRADEIVLLMAQETGCANAFSRFQIQWAVGLLRQAAGYPYLSGGEIVPSDTPGVFAMAIRKPLGVVGGISPWNGSLALGFRTVVAPLACGNTVVLKPSEDAPVCAGLLIGEIMTEAGFPPGVLNVITHAPGQVAQIADPLFERREVRAYNFTGSSATGSILAARAGKHLKRISLELGGYNPMIVLKDADLEYSVDTAIFAAFFHQGQICMNTRKILVDRAIFNDFLERFVSRAKTIKAGDPADPANKIGPLINDQAVANVKNGIAQAVKAGARVLAGGNCNGRCFEPTVLVDVPPHAPIYCEEVFGPVVQVEPFDSESEALQKANATQFGLSASVMTGDVWKGVSFAGEIQAGMVNVNGPTMGGEPQIPFGGVKDSGWARFGRWAIEMFTDLNLVTVSRDKRKYPL